MNCSCILRLSQLSIFLKMYTDVMNLECDIKKSKLMQKKEQTCDDIK